MNYVLIRWRFREAMWSHRAYVHGTTGGFCIGVEYAGDGWSES